MRQETYVYGPYPAMPDDRAPMRAEACALYDVVRECRRRDDNLYWVVWTYTYREEA